MAADRCMLYKKAVSSVYDTEVFRSLLKDMLHPGGVALTRRVAEIAHAQPGLMVLDIGCGSGAGCFLFCKAYGCTVVGIDLSEGKIVSAREHAKDEGLAGKAGFVVSDAEVLPFPDASFDVVISECAFSILPDKMQAAEEISRVLRPKGRMVFTDIVLKEGGVRGMEGSFSENRGVPLIPCLSGAGSLEEYTSMFEKAGLHRATFEDHTVSLKKVAYQMALNFGDWSNFLCRLSAQLCSRIADTQRIDVDSYSLDRHRDILRRAKLGYALIGMIKA
jgi:arsenite methyltransferase